MPNIADLLSLAPLPGLGVAAEAGASIFARFSALSEPIAQPSTSTSSSTMSRSTRYFSFQSHIYPSHLASGALQVSPEPMCRNAAYASGHGGIQGWQPKDEGRHRWVRKVGISLLFNDSSHSYRSNSKVLKIQSKMEEWSKLSNLKSMIKQADISTGLGTMLSPPFRCKSDRYYEQRNYTMISCFRTVDSRSAHIVPPHIQTRTNMRHR
jgi:hypothetical protein